MKKNRLVAAMMTVAVRIDCAAMYRVLNSLSLLLYLAKAEEVIVHEEV